MEEEQSDTHLPFPAPPRLAYVFLQFLPEVWDWGLGGMPPGNL